jgi:2-amino-4-hydroxy-6-hydroxymethyldihydropteridine diphosphokinase
MTETGYLSLGSNIGDRLANLREAISQLTSAGTVEAVSSFYETAPVEFVQQGWFINCAVALETRLAPAELMKSLLSIERAMGRHRDTPKGPRIIDIDILLYGNAVIATAELTIPHPAMHLRRFVLVPLAEIAPDAYHPVLMRSAEDLAASLPDGEDSVRRL